MKPFYDEITKTVIGESCVFSDVFPCRLMVPARKILRSANALTGEIYREGEDFSFTPGDSVLIRTDHSRIPCLSFDELHPPAGTSVFPAPGFSAIPTYPGDLALLRLDGRNFFQSQQFEVDYLSNSWPDPFSGLKTTKLLPRFRESIENRSPLSVSLIGDSISAGFNATGFIGNPPWQPPYIDLFTKALAERTGIPVSVKNRAVNGAGSLHALTRDREWREDHPDLLIVAYGMNDYFELTDSEFIGNIGKIVSEMNSLSPKTEILLITPMTGNPEFRAYSAEKDYSFRHALLAFGRERNVAVCDLQQVWTYILERKGFFAMTGNGINHPNDYGHRIYAEALVRMFFIPDNCLEQQSSPD